MNIQEIKLQCNELNDVKHFYAQRLGLPVVHLSQNGIKMKVGRSVIHFEQSDIPAYYHFAFNIPSNQIEKCVNWIRERAAILPFEGKDIVDFPNWNAHSVYFKDPVGNIVECIARHNLNITSDAKFDYRELLSISEIGMPLTHLPPAITALQKKYNLDQYWGNRSQFAAMGNEKGLFILVDENEKKWFPTDLPAKSFPLKIQTDIGIFSSEKGQLDYP